MHDLKLNVGGLEHFCAIDLFNLLQTVPLPAVNGPDLFELLLDDVVGLLDALRERDRRLRQLMVRAGLPEGLAAVGGDALITLSIRIGRARGELDRNHVMGSHLCAELAEVRRLGLPAVSLRAG